MSGPVGSEDLAEGIDPGSAAALVVEVTESREATVGGHLAYLGVGRDELPLDASETARALLLGGPPFPERVLIWWNYVAREPAEIVAAHADWLAAGPRFGAVASPLERVVTGPPPWRAQ